jgi:hypothetical protein
MYFMDRNAWPPHIDQNRAQHHYVTTPIAYLSTSIIDIFAQSQTAMKDTTWINSQGQYHCEPAYFWHTGQWTGAIANYPNYFKVQNRNAAFYVMSYGPDQDFDQYKSDSALYEMSNGLTSNGDLLTPVQGDFRKGYPYTSSN